VYTALLWAYDLLNQLDDVADPALDREGLALSLPKTHDRVRAKNELDNDF